MDARVAIDGRDMGTLGRKRLRDRRADAPCRPKDHHHVLRQSEIHNAFAPEVGDAVHFAR